jgi:hypothetical protein
MTNKDSLKGSITSTMIQGKIPGMPSDFIPIHCVPLSGIKVYFFVYMTCGTSDTQVTRIFFWWHTGKWPMIQLNHQVDNTKLHKLISVVLTKRHQGRSELWRLLQSEHIATNRVTSQYRSRWSSSLCRKVANQRKSTTWCLIVHLLTFPTRSPIQPSTSTEINWRF